MQALSEGLEQLYSLESLHLSSNKIDLEGAQVVLEALKNKEHLTSLNFSGNTFCGKPELQEPLFNDLSHLEQLKFLYLNDLKIEKEAARRLSLYLGNLTNLEVLNLSNNRFFHDGSQALFQSNVLGKLTKLRKLYLSANGFGVKGARLLSQFLGNLTELETLDLGGNSLYTSGLELIVPGFVRLKNLKFLELSNVQCDQKGLKKLLETLKENEHLKQLNLKYNQFNKTLDIADTQKLLNDNIPNVEVFL